MSLPSGYQTIIQYIDAHLKDEITIEEIANAAGYSANHVYKVFKIFSPYPVMEYVRRKKLFAAVGEMYIGRKLYDIALDYGYETPAGFYKAFKSVFGCSPSAYKNNIKGVEDFMRIDNIKSVEELDSVLTFFKTLRPNHPLSAIDETSDEKFGRKWWIERFNKNPELMLFATDKDDAVCAAAIGFDDGGCVTVHEGVLPQYQATGIFEALFVELEKRAKQFGFANINLGIAEGEEEFYAKLDYIGKTLIQSEKYGVDELKAFNARYNNYEVTGAGVYEGHINQLWLNVSLLDRRLKKHYESEIGDCWVQVIAGKEL